MGESSVPSTLDLELKTGGGDLDINDEVRASKEPIDAHYDPKFVSRTLYVFLSVTDCESAEESTLFRRKIDWRMLPLLGVIYSIALIDRTNLGVARIAGMEADLVRITDDSNNALRFRADYVPISASTSVSDIASHR
jgi:hypothetical protein